MPRRVRRSKTGGWEERMQRYNGEETWVRVRPEEKADSLLRTVGLLVLVLALVFIAFAIIMQTRAPGPPAQPEGRGKSSPEVEFVGAALVPSGGGAWTS